MTVNCVCCFSPFDKSNGFTYTIDGRTAYSCGDEECEGRILSLTADDVEQQVYLTGANAGQCREWVRS